MLSRAKNCRLDKLEHAGVLTKGGGKVRLVPRQAMPEDPPENARDMTVWGAGSAGVHGSAEPAGAE